MPPPRASSFGPIPGIRPGHEFFSRIELHLAGVHRPTQAGISARAGEGAESIVLSGGYEDDADFGDLVLYTGAGGRSAETGQQVADQTLTGPNLELARNLATGLPVRVTRKVTEGRRSFYRYAGLYRVAGYWHETGRSGHQVWRYRLERLPEEISPARPAPAATSTLFTQAEEPAAGYGPAERRPTTTLRLVRDTALTRQIKHLYDYHCQACLTRLLSPAGPYAEAAHIRPLGTPHHGPDALENILCLCPNHHVLFDLGAWAVAPDYRLLGLPGELHVHRRHALAAEHLAYHRAHLYTAAEPLAE